MSNIIIIAYDISDNKVRTHFSKFLSKYGVRVQLSVYEIENSQRILDIVINKIEQYFKKRFSSGDSIYIFKSNKRDTISYGSANLLDSDLIIL